MNSDTTINVLDVVALVNKILTGNNSGLTACDECFAAIAPDQDINDYDECRVMGDDTNGDELLNVLDAVSLVSFVLGTSISDFLAADSLCTACHESLTACDSGQFDCLGVCNGSATLDCAGQCEGNSNVDECGVCGGGGISAGACDCEGNVDLGCGCGEVGPSGCDNVCGSTTTVDECGVCGGGGISAGACDCEGNVDLGCGCGAVGPSGCDNLCGSTATMDECGVCGGSGIAAGACDCAGNTADMCGVCGGSNDTVGQPCGTGNCMGGVIECDGTGGTVCSTMPSGECDIPDGFDIININADGGDITLDVVLYSSKIVDGYHFDVDYGTPPSVTAQEVNNDWLSNTNAGFTTLAGIGPGSGLVTALGFMVYSEATTTFGQLIDGVYSGVSAGRHTLVSFTIPASGVSELCIRNASVAHAGGEMTTYDDVCRPVD